VDSCIAQQANHHTQTACKEKISIEISNVSTEEQYSSQVTIFSRIPLGPVSLKFQMYQQKSSTAAESQFFSRIPLGAVSFLLTGISRIPGSLKGYECIS
jgi:hypothetical protein